MLDYYDCEPDDYEIDHYECRECQEHEDNIEHAADHFTAVLEILYGSGEIDVAKLEGHLDEVQHALGMKLQPQAFMPSIQRKQTKTFNLTINNAKIA